MLDSSLSNRTIAITGATGFVGQAIVSEIAEVGAKIRILSRKNTTQLKGIFCDDIDLGLVEFYKGDVSECSDSLRRFVDGADFIIHAASELVKEDSMFGTNVLGTENLLKSLGEKNCPAWIQLSSAGAYSGYQKGVIDSTYADRPTGIYEVTKCAADVVVRSKLREATILRPSTVVGEEMVNASLFALLGFISKGIYSEISSDDDAFFNHIHVKDVARLVKLSIEDNDQFSGRTIIASLNYQIADFVCQVRKELHRGKILPAFSERFVRKLCALEHIVPKWPITRSRVDALTRSVSFSDELRSVSCNFEYQYDMEEIVRNLIAGAKRRRYL